MDPRNYVPSCAVCGGPSDPECPCEGERLRLCIDAAEKRWIESWITKIRELITNNAVQYITNIFGQLKQARVANYIAYLHQIPNYDFYARYQGRPPLHPHVLHQIQFQIAEAKADLRRDIDQDWRACVLRYPEVLAHFYNQVNLQLPGEFEPPTLSGFGSIAPPPVPAPPPPTPQSNVSAAAAAAAAAATAAGVPLGFGGIPMQPRPTPSRTASQTKKSNLSSRKMSKNDRDMEADMIKRLQQEFAKVNAGMAGASATRPPPGAPMPPTMYPGMRT